MRRRTVLAGALALGGAGVADGWAALRAGGVVLFRHASAPGVGDPVGFRLEDCSTQRNLGDGGRRQATAIGARFRAEGVVVGRVIGSEWCRTRETAALAFGGRFEGEAAFNSFFGDAGSEAARTARARETLAGWRGPGVLVVVTHQVNITALTGVVPGDGEGVVVRVDGSRVEVLGRVSG